jgi:acetyl-CoA synthetase
MDRSFCQTNLRDTPATVPESPATSGGVDPVSAEIILARHPKVLEVVVVSVTHAQHGQVWVAFVIPKPGLAPSPDLRHELWHALSQQVGPIAAGNDLRFAASLPKTRSGKILRRSLQEMATGTTAHSA